MTRSVLPLQIPAFARLGKKRPAREQVPSGHATTPQLKGAPMRRCITAATAALFVLIAAPAAATGGGGQGHDKKPVCHKPGTPAEKTLYLPAPAIPGHLGHGDYLGVCKPAPVPPPPPPPVKPPVVEPPVVTPPPPPPAPVTNTTTTVTNNVTTNVTVTLPPAAVCPVACPGLPPGANPPVKPAAPPVKVKRGKRCKTIRVIRYRKVWIHGEDCFGNPTKWYTYKKIKRKRRICM